MVKRITLALTFVAALAVAGLGINSRAEARGCHHHHDGYYAAYSYGPSVGVTYGYAPVYSGYYGYGVPVRAYRPLPAVRTYPRYHSGVYFSVGF